MPYLRCFCSLRKCKCSPNNLHRVHCLPRSQTSPRTDSRGPASGTCIPSRDSKNGTNNTPCLRHRPRHRHRRRPSPTTRSPRAGRGSAARPTRRSTSCAPSSSRRRRAGEAPGNCTAGTSECWWGGGRGVASDRTSSPRIWKGNAASDRGNLFGRWTGILLIRQIDWRGIICGNLSTHFYPHSFLFAKSIGFGFVGSQICWKNDGNTVLPPLDVEGFVTESHAVRRERNNTTASTGKVKVQSKPTQFMFDSTGGSILEHERLSEPLLLFQTSVSEAIERDSIDEVSSSTATTRSCSKHSSSTNSLDYEQILEPLIVNPPIHASFVPHNQKVSLSVHSMCYSLYSLQSPSKS